MIKGIYHEQQYKFAEIFLYFTKLLKYSRETNFNNFYR